MRNIVSSKRNSAIFLATILVAGTIATISPSFMLGAVQAEPYYGMDDRYDSYEQEYTDNNNYEPTEYPSYKPEYSSDNNNYKSKDSSSSVINKIKCNNINSNNNGVDVSLGVPNNDDTIAETQAEDEGQATSANEWGYGNEYKQKDNGFKFVCVNNNDNENNIVVVKETTPIPPPPPEPPITCEECFLDVLGAADFAKLLNFLAGPTPKAFDSLEQFCTFLQIVIADAPLETITNDINVFLTSAGISLTNAELAALVACIYDVLAIGTDNNTGGLTAPNINTDTSAFDINKAGGLAASFSSQPTIAQGTEEDSSALEKIEKLKQQWLDLLP